MNKYLRWGFRLIGPALLLIFLWRSDFTRLVASFGSINPWPVLLSMALMPVFIAIKAWRWNLLMNELGMQAPPLGYSMVLYTIGLYLGGLTPGQSGDFIKAWYLKERGQALAPALFSIVLDRLFDFLVMALLALLALVEFLDVLPRSAQIGTVAFAAIVFTLTPLLMARGPREWLIARALPLLPARLRNLIARWGDQLGALSLRPALAGQLLLASAGSALSTIARIYLLFLAMSLVNITLLSIISSNALIAILQALPFSFAGIGVRDAILVLVLGRYGYSTEQALTLSALYLIVNIEHIVVGFLVSLRYPLGSPPPVESLGEAEPAK